MSHRLAVLVLVGFCFSATSTKAQITNITDQVSTPAPGTGHDYIHLLNETVNPANGSLSVRVQVPLPPGRQISIPFSFAYDSGNATFLQPNPTTGAGWQTNRGPFAFGGWSYALPTLARNSVKYTYTGPTLPDGSTVCQSTSSYIFTDAAGGSHELGLAHIYSYSGGQISDACQYAHYSEFDAGGDDLAYPAALVGPSIPPDGSTTPTLSEGIPTTAGPDGTVYSFAANWYCMSGTSSSNNGFPTSVTDRNGNTVLIGGSPSASCTTLGITDTLGGTAVSAPFSMTGTSDVTVAGLSSPYKVTWGTATSGFTYTSNQLQPDSNCSMPPGTNTGAAHVVTSITLPNGQAYAYSYESTYGQINKITFPSGGYVSYVWGLNPQASQVQFTDTQNVSGGCLYSYDVPAVKTRIVSFDGTTEALEQDFTYTTTWGTGSNVGRWTQKTTTIVTKDLIRGTSFVTSYTYGPNSNAWAPNTTMGFTGSQSPLELSIQSFDTNGVLLKTVTEGWFAKNELACSLTQIGNTNLISGSFYSFGAGQQVTHKKEYDYGAITSASVCTNGATAPVGVQIARETVTTYQPFPSPAWHPSGPIILDRPATIQVYAGSAATGTLTAETDFTYDNGTPTVGNATKIVKKCLQTGAACASGNSTTTYTYDSKGQVTSMTDACGNVTCSDMVGTNHTTTYSYADVYSNSAGCSGNAPPISPSDAYLTQITYPATNGVSHSVNFCYDYATGLLLTSADENGQVTAYKYADPLNRLTQINYPPQPGGGETSYTYNDTPPNPTVTTTEIATPSPTITSVKEMDGVGHSIQTELSSDAAGADYAATTYDGLGHAYKAYNLTRCSPPTTNCGEATWGVTQFSYDALGRTTLVTHPDGSTAQTTYTGRATEVTDEGNGTKTVQRISQTDGLGRLQYICEVTSVTLGGTGGTPAACGLDISGTGFLTTYAYDVLDNLTSVAQGGLNGRSFTYNSLSRLLTSINPESGTITYTYDANGNVATKTDARSNVTTSTYDDLNRATQESYSDSTPTANSVFDVCPTGGCPTGVTITNSTGRLVESYNSNAQTFESYDPMGRVADEWQCTPVNCGATPWHLHYVYDLAGHVTSYTDGLGNTFTQTFDAASQLTQMTSSLNDAQHPGTPVSGLVYNPLGDATTAVLANGLTESLVYGNRSQLQSETVSNGLGATPATGIILLSGTEQSYQAVATQSTSTVEISGNCNSCSGTARMTVGSYQATANFSNTNATGVAQALGTALNNSGIVTAIGSNVTSGVAKVVMTSIATGTSANYSVSCGGATGFQMSPCPSMTGGTNGGTVYDSGTITASVNGVTENITYMSTSTSTSLASAVASAFNGNPNSPVTATASGGSVSFTSKATGAGANYSVVISSTSGNSSHFSPPSFAITDSGGSLVGGTGGYGYAVAYAPNGDLAAGNDSVNGNWAYTYDDFNRLVGAACSLHCPDSQNTQAFTYAYDRYANLWQKNVTAGTGPMLSVTFSTGNNNRIDTFSYDASGNLLNDGTHVYAYNAESEITTVDTGTTATYLYDADGRRVRKTTATATVDYVYDLAGHQIAEVNSSGAWTREEVYAGGHHLATYSGGAVGGTTYFDHTDWLGTERGRSNMAGTICETIVSLPFGDGEVTSGSCGDVSPMHYTGKQRDTETNLDDFDARYYSSQYGRFMSSDWSADPEPVPYANLTNPQTLNLYAIVNDNVMTFADLNGHVPLLGQGQLCRSALTCNEVSGPSCTLDGLAVSCAIVIGLEGPSAIITEDSIPLTSDHSHGQSDPAKTDKAQTQKPKPKHKAKLRLVVTAHRVLKNVPVAKDQTLTTAKFGFGYMSSDGKISPAPADETHTLVLTETYEPGHVGSAKICSSGCEWSGNGNQTDTDWMYVTTGDNFVLDKRFTIDGQTVRAYDIDTGKGGDYIRQVASNGTTSLSFKDGQ